ncbi:MAG: hypothetical protein CMD23_03855 [Flavobacteriales bacterium]|nr:hypothetical protein [Flavobacteriales bacterium]
MLKTILFIFISMFNAAFFNKIVVTNKLIKIPSYLFSLILIIVSLPMITHPSSLIILTTIILLIATYNEIIQFNNKNKKTTILKSGFFIGLMTTIDLNFWIFYLLILFGLFYYQEFNWRNFVIQLLGLILPLIFYYNLKLLDFEFINLMYTQHYSTKPSLNILDEYPVFLSLLSILLILSGKELYNNYYKKTEHAKKGFIIILIIIPIVIVNIILYQKLQFGYLLALPITMLIGNYLIYVKQVYFRTFLLGLLFVSFLFDIF